MHPTKRPFDNLLRPKFSKLYRLPFSRYSSFKFWSRDYHVIMTSQKFFIWLSKCPFSQPFIWGAAIGRTCFGSRDIWLLNFDHVTTWSRDFLKFFKAFSGLCPMGPYQVCSVNWPYLLWFSQNKAPQHCLYIYIGITVNFTHSLWSNEKSQGYQFFCVA